jgi:uncharacterized protein
MRRGGHDTPPPAPAPVRWRTEVRVSIFICCGDTIAGQPLHEAIVQRASRAGLAGATVIHGFAGFGRSAVVRKPGLLGRSGYEPVLIEIADSSARVQAFLPELGKLAPEALVLLKSVQVAEGLRLPRVAAIAAP